MDKVITRSFCCDMDFALVDDFLSRTYSCDGITNWENSRWAFNRYCVHSKEELSKNRSYENSVQLWEDNKGELIAAAHIEEPGDYFFQVHPSYKYLEEEMLLWAIDNCGKYYPNLDKITVTSCQVDYGRKELYLKYGAVKRDYLDPTRIIGLNKEYALPKLPEGYKIINLDSEDPEACKKVSDLYTYIWPESTYIPNAETVASMTTAVSYKKELSFIIVDDKNQYAAFTILWVDSLNKLAHFYPVGVNPNYLDTDILEYMLKKTLNTLTALNYEKAILGACYGKKENEIFEKCGLTKTFFEEIYDIKLK